MVPLRAYTQDIEVLLWQCQQKNVAFVARVVYPIAFPSHDQQHFSKFQRA